MGGRAAASQPDVEDDVAIEPARPRSEKVAVAVEAHAGESSLSERWDEIAPAERVAALRGQLRVAMTRLHDGHDLERTRAQADAALSALRAELYPTEAGRREHERLERALDEAWATAARLPDEGHRP